MELKEIQGRIEDESHGDVPSYSESEDEQWFLNFNEKGRDVFLKDIRVVVEDIDNRLKNVEFGFGIKEKLLVDEKKMLKNMSQIQKLDSTRWPCLRKSEKVKLLAKVKKANELLKKIKSKHV